MEAQTESQTDTEYQERVEQAAREFLDRKARTEHPAGSFDNAGRWYPDDAERCTWCDTIREPSINYPYSLMVHCRTADHIAARMDVDPGDVRRRARQIVKGQ